MTRRGGGVLSFACAAVLASTQLAGSCTDGVTPDCSDAAVCAPSSGDASSSDGSIPEASSDTGVDSSTPSDAGLDAIADADADGG